MAQAQSHLITLTADVQKANKHMNKRDEIAKKMKEPAHWKARRTKEKEPSKWYKYEKATGGTMRFTTKHHPDTKKHLAHEKELEGRKARYRAEQDAMMKAANDKLYGRNK